MTQHKPTTVLDRLKAFGDLWRLSDADYHAYMGTYTELFTDSPENTKADYELGIPMKGYDQGSSDEISQLYNCLLYTSPSPRDRTRSRMPSSA